MPFLNFRRFPSFLHSIWKIEYFGCMRKAFARVLRAASRHRLSLIVPAYLDFLKKSPGYFLYLPEEICSLLHKRAHGILISLLLLQTEKLFLQNSESRFPDVLIIGCCSSFPDRALPILVYSSRYLLLLKIVGKWSRSQTGELCGRWENRIPK